MIKVKAPATKVPSLDQEIGGEGLPLKRLLDASFCGQVLGGCPGVNQPIQKSHHRVVFVFGHGHIRWLFRLLFRWLDAL